MLAGQGTDGEREEVKTTKRTRGSWYPSTDSGQALRTAGGTRALLFGALAEAGPVLQQDAAVHYDEDASGAGLLRGLFVNHFFLHPHGRDF